MKFSGFFVFAVTNCQDDLDFCKNSFNQKKYPTIIHINKGEDFTRRQKDAVELPFTLKGIIYEIFNEFHANLIEGTHTNLNQLFFSARQKEKMPLFLAYQDVLIM